MNNDAAHVAHCCAGIHGCKYLDDDCPVANGRLPPAYKCQDCEDRRNELVLHLETMTDDELHGLIMAIADVMAKRTAG